MMQKAVLIVREISFTTLLKFNLSWTACLSIVGKTILNL